MRISDWSSDVCSSDLVLAIVSGPATSIVTLGDAVNRPLIEQLVARGATIAVCGQALHQQGIDRAAVAPEVRIDVSALATMANLQLKGDRKSTRLNSSH